MEQYGKSVIEAPGAPTPIGPYSQAVRAGGLIFVSGQLALDPTSGELVGADAAEQTRLVMKHIESILDVAQSGLARIVKTTIYLTDLADFSAVNDVYAESFPMDPPARSTVQVAALPKGARVEIEAVATAPTTSSAADGGTPLMF